MIRRFAPRVFGVVAAALLGTVPAFAELPDQLRLDHLGIEAGLSSSAISRIIQDDNGFIWFATQSGLNRYDGYAVERYEHDPFDRNSLSHNLIQTMYHDDSGIFWIGTHGGLNRFDPESEGFRHYESDPQSLSSLSNNVVVAITRDAEGSLWVGTLNGLNRLDSETGRFAQYMDGDPEAGELPDKVVRTLALDAHGTLWVGTYGGLSRYLPGEDAFETVADGPGGRGEPDGTGGSRDSEDLPSPYVMDILPDPRSDSHLWVGTWGGGVSRFNIRTGQVETFVLPHNEIYAMLMDSGGRLWIGTWGNGLYVMDPDTGEFRHFGASEGYLESGLSHNVVYSLLEDESGIIWIGTNGGGVHKYVPWENRFTSFVHRTDDANSIPAGKVESIHVDEDGTEWFGSYGGGLSRRDPDNETITRYVYDDDDPASLSNNIVNEVYRDSRGDLWIGTNDGLNRYLPEKDEFERIYSYSDAYSLPEDVVFDIAEDPSGDLWMGTHTAGIAVRDQTSGRYRAYSHDPHDPESISDNLVRDILHDSRGNTWIATNDGLNRYDPESDGFIRYFHERDDRRSLSNDSIRALHEDRRGRLWIATGGGGVNRYDYEADAFSFLSTADGLASNHVTGILEDHRGALWFCTNRGVSVYDPETESFRSINRSNGLLSNELTQGYAKGPDGRLYLGSQGGVTVIDPEDDAYSDYTPRIVITGLQVLGKPRPVREIEAGGYQELVLQSDESFFSVEFAALDFSSPRENTYAYQLEGFDAGWVNAGSRNFAGYTNLDPGSYVLRVKGAGSQANWNEQGLELPIRVLPPWWASSVAHVAYALLFLSAVMLAYFSIRRRGARAAARLAEQERRNAELERKVRERTAEIEQSRATAERATHEKSLFLANMSHEIRTPLNGMVGMLSLLGKTELGERQREYLRYSQVSAENLSTLVNDLLDFERIEAGELRLSHEPFSLSESAHYIDRLFEDAVRRKGLAFDVRVDLGDAADRVMGDRSRVIQVLTNLVSNAVKYTNAGRITLYVAPAPQDVPGAGTRTYMLEVADTGLGIDRDHLETVFNRFTQVDSGYTKGTPGVGLGLAIVKQVVDAMGGDIEVESTPGEGSIFRVFLPLAVETAAETGGNERDADRPSVPATNAPDRNDGGGADSRERTGTILVCEDEAISRLYLKHHLENLGYSVEVASDGIEAVERVTAAASQFSLILMDLSMPQVSGLEAARRIRAGEQRAGCEAVPIVALTAHTYEDDIRTCRDAGMDDFVSKPIQEIELKRALDRWI